MKFGSIVILLSLILTTRCSKNCADLTPDQNTNKLLRDKPFDTIRSKISGKWHLFVETGGLSGSQTIYPENTFIEFNLQSNFLNDSLKWYDDTAIYVDSELIWKWDAAIKGDSTYLILFEGIPGFIPNRLIPYDISKTEDTLLLMDDYFDGYNYFLERVD